MEVVSQIVTDLFDLTKEIPRTEKRAEEKDPRVEAIVSRYVLSDCACVCAVCVCMCGVSKCFKVFLGVCMCVCVVSKCI